MSGTYRYRGPGDYEYEPDPGWDEEPWANKVGAILFGLFIVALLVALIWIGASGGGVSLVD